MVDLTYNYSCRIFFLSKCVSTPDSPSIQQGCCNSVIHLMTLLLHYVLTIIQLRLFYRIFFTLHAA